MYSWLSAGDDIGWDELGKSDQPKACCLGFPVSMLPWLDILRGIPAAGSGILMHDRVFGGDLGDIGPDELVIEICGQLHILPPDRIDAVNL